MRTSAYKMPNNSKIDSKYLLFNFIIMIISVFIQNKYRSSHCVISEEEFHVLENKQISRDLLTTIIPHVE